MTDRQHWLEAIGEAIENSERCSDYGDERGRQQCDGLDGCAACRELAAGAVLAILSPDDAEGADRAPGRRRGRGG